MKIEKLYKENQKIMRNTHRMNRMEIEDGEIENRYGRSRGV